MSFTSFTSLTREEVEILRKKPMAVPPGKEFTYNFTQIELNNAKAHLETLYTDGQYVTKHFANDMRILYELYKDEYVIKPCTM